MKLIELTSPPGTVEAKGRNGYFNIAGIQVSCSEVLSPLPDGPVIYVEIHSKRTLGRDVAACLFELNREDARALAAALLEAGA